MRWPEGATEPTAERRFEEVTKVGAYAVQLRLDLVGVHGGLSDWTNRDPGVLSRRVERLRTLFTSLSCMFVGPVGLEPTTYGLKVRSSAN